MYCTRFAPSIQSVQWCSVSGDKRLSRDFVSWATVSFAQRLEGKMEQIETQLQDECNADEEEDGEMQIDA